MKYLLDTNTCIEYLNQGDGKVAERILQLSPDDVCICDVVKYELYFGAYKSTRTDANIEILEHFFGDLISHPFDQNAALICGQIRASLQSRGTPIGAYDLQIAAIALANQLTLVTHNVREFSRVEDLTIEDWQA